VYKLVVTVTRHAPPPGAQPFLDCAPHQASRLTGSELHLFNGDLGAAVELYPRIQGHEVSGIIE